jgi:hypothetical protein
MALTAADCAGLHRFLSPHSVLRRKQPSRGDQQSNATNGGMAEISHRKLFKWVSESHEARVFPSWNRRGGCAIKKKTASEAAQTGWSVVTKCFALHFCNILRN